MLKIGRNDPCHCGSGKKYKKCCADADQQKALTHDTQPYEAAITPFYDVVNNQKVQYQPSDYDSEEEDDNELSYPTISAEEEKLVDEWWDVYREIDSIEEVRSHLDGFADKYPHLVENLGLEHEVLFELGAEYRRQERTDEYIAFLTDFRIRFTATYARSAGYYDADIIAWLISKGRTSEIKHYLNYFIEEPVRFVDQLYEVIYILLATDHTDEIIPLITMVAKPIVESDEVIYGEDIVHPLLINTLYPYIKEPFTEENVQRFVEDLKEQLPYEISMDDNIVEIWSGKLQAITRPFDRWPETVPSKLSAQRKQWSEIRYNFMRYLQETLKISWMSAQYYADLIYEYLAKHLEGKKGKKKHLFDFSRKNVENMLALLTREMFIHVNCTKFLALLNAVHFFAAYLHRCNNFTTEEMEIVQMDCKNIYNQFYPELRKEYLEALCFAEFPVTEVV
jgi:hypothetical protein